MITNSRQAQVGVVILTFFTLTALFAGALAPYGNAERVGEIFEAPSSEFWLGTDDVGADMVSLLMYGARVSLLVGFAAALVAMVIGTTVGIVAGYFGGRTDTVLMRITDYFLVIPDVPLVIIISAIWGRSLKNIVIIIGIIYWTSTARLIRSQVKTLRERVYVKRAKALGASDSRRHLQARPAPGGAPDRGQHRAADRLCDLPRDRARLPRPG